MVYNDFERNYNSKNDKCASSITEDAHLHYASIAMLSKICYNKTAVNNHRIIPQIREKITKKGEKHVYSRRLQNRFTIFRQDARL